MATIEELRALLAKATPGPWEVGGPYPTVSVIKVDKETYDPETNYVDCFPVCIVDEKTTKARCEDDPDAALIAAMRNSYEALLDVAAAARAKVRDDDWQSMAKLKEALARLLGSKEPTT